MISERKFAVPQNAQHDTKFVTQTRGTRPCRGQILAEHVKPNCPRPILDIATDPVARYSFVRGDNTLSALEIAVPHTGHCAAPTVDLHGTKRAPLQHQRAQPDVTIT